MINLHIVSTNRADVGHLEPLLHAADADRRFDPFMTHRDLPQLNGLSINKSEIVFLQGDRTELLEIAAQAVRQGCIIAHAAGGERTRGSTDDRVRDAITKLAHLHYPVHVAARNRLLNLCEEEWRICVTGEIGVDTIKNGGVALLPPDVPATSEDIVVAVHPVTARPEETEAVLECVHRIVSATKGRAWLASPNSDPGSEKITSCWDELVRTTRNCFKLPLLTQPQFCTLMKRCGTIIGNSSCLITEAPHLGVLTVLIGSRQEGRLPAPSDGDACKKILDHLAECVTDSRVRVKT